MTERKYGDLGDHQEILKRLSKLIELMEEQNDILLFESSEDLITLDDVAGERITCGPDCSCRTADVDLAQGFDCCGCKGKDEDR
ncbi:unnamed protein product [marine sediment metagenome]|uniref:Uncharacterized protein n=1 Tax=marine sediment metagenome TaxID=412755 RepID=X0UPP3_9ZZZZ